MLIKQPVDISFAQGVDTKTDPWRVSIGKFLSLVNMVFTTGMRLTKRNGFGDLVSSSDSPTYLTTFNGNLTAIGSSLEAYSDTTQQLYNKGTLQPVELDVLPLIRSNTNQSQVDAATSNGLVCTVYTDQTPTSLSTPRYLYAIADSTTGQNLIEPTLIPANGGGTITGSPRVFVLGTYFIIIFTNVISAANDLQYIAVSSSNPSVVTSPVNIAASYSASSGLSWDGVTIGQYLYIGYDTASGGQSIQIKSLSSTLLLSGATTYTNSGKVTATILSMAADVSNPSIPIIWAAYYNSGTSTGYAVAVNATLAKVISTPAEIITTGTINNLAPVASNGVLTVYYEVLNNYSYATSVDTNYISQITCTQAGVVGSPSVLVRSVGLASKAFIVNSTYYFLAAFQSVYQNTYFLLNGSGEVVARIAYGNGGGYCSVGLPSVTVTGNEAQIGYLFKDFITTENTSTTQSITKSNIYSQTGINLVSFTIGTSNVTPIEIAQTLNLSGGFLWEYDGYIPVEQNFFLWPDPLGETLHNTGGAMVPQEYQYQAVYRWTNNQGNVEFSAPSIPLIADMSTNNVAFTQPSALTPTANLVQGSAVLASVSSFAGIQVGQYVTDTTTPGNIQANSYIVSFNSGAGTITLNQPVTANASGDALSTVDRCSVTVNVPTLRLTYKTANPVVIDLYRWSTAQEEFFQVTSIETPLVNDPTVDSVAYVDTQADNQISGNALIYTTGGVVENIGAPSFNALTLFDDRPWGINAEDPNSLWYGKQVIEATPVEMSDLFTLYVAPSIGSQGSTGNMRCVAPMDDKLIIFKENALYYINGTGPDNTGANNLYSQPIFITAVVGSSNQQSIVFMPDGLMFQSDKGIWLLGRDLSVQYIGAPVEAYTKNSLVQSAVAVPGTTQVRFTLDSGQWLMYDYFYQQWGIFSGIPAISSTLYNDLHTYLDSNGNIFQETNGEYLDSSNPVVMQFTTSWINLSGLQGYQRAYWFFMLGEYISPHFLQVGISYDYDASNRQSTLISPTNYSAPYGGVSPYGQQTPYGGGTAREQWRVFLTKQRCEAVQISIQEIYDASLGVPAGAGLTISGINMIIGIPGRYRHVPTIGAAQSIGANATGTGDN